MGKILLVALGVYAGVLLKQQYTVPRVPSPGDVLERLKACEEGARREDCAHHRRRRAEDAPTRAEDAPTPNKWENWREDRANMWERFKEFEMSQRNQHLAQATPPSSATPSVSRDE